MDEPDLHQHLSRINTHWTMVFQAHGGEGAKVTEAQERLLTRYCGAIFRYLQKALGNPHAAEELSQEFALHFLQGYFKGADPQRGRFRDYVKTALFNLMRKHYRRQNKQPKNLDLETQDPAAPPETSEHDRQFISGWRDELLARTWEGLAKWEADSGQNYHTFLSYRTRNPEATSAQMALELSQRLGKTITAVAVRQTIHRARAKFADLLIDEVAQTLQTTDLDQIEQELIDLGIHSYCEEGIKMRRGKKEG